MSPAKIKEIRSSGSSCFSLIFCVEVHDATKKESKKNVIKKNLFKPSYYITTIRIGKVQKNYI